MKQFIRNKGSNVDGTVLSDNDIPRPAVFLTPGQAKFMAVFKGIREAQKQ